MRPANDLKKRKRKKLVSINYNLLIKENGRIKVL